MKLIGLLSLGCRLELINRIIIRHARIRSTRILAPGLSEVRTRYDLAAQHLQRGPSEFMVVQAEQVAEAPAQQVGLFLLKGREELPCGHLFLHLVEGSGFGFGLAIEADCLCSDAGTIALKVSIRTASSS